MPLLFVCLTTICHAVQFEEIHYSLVQPACSSSLCESQLMQAPSMLLLRSVGHNVHMYVLNLNTWITEGNISWISEWIFNKFAPYTIWQVLMGEKKNVK